VWLSCLPGVDVCALVIAAMIIVFDRGVRPQGQAQIAALPFSILTRHIEANAKQLS
jgi:hypothetical protein